MEGSWNKKPKGRTTLIWVHGILSNGKECWLNENGCYWPTLIANEGSIDDIGSYVFTYQTGIFSGNYRISDIVDSLKTLLKLDSVLDSENLIFICHSMGGIIVRKYIVERASELIKMNKKIGLFLIASPSLGSNYANWLSPLAKLQNHAQADILRFVRNNQWLSDLNKEFLNLKENGDLIIEGKEIVEDKFVVLKKLLFFRQIVEPFSGAVYFGEQIKIPKSDHSSIAKPKNEKSLQHRILVQTIKEIEESFENSAKNSIILKMDIAVYDIQDNPLPGTTLRLNGQNFLTNSNGISHYNFLATNENSTNRIEIEKKDYCSISSEVNLINNDVIKYNLKKKKLVLSIAVNDIRRSLNLDKEIEEIENALYHEDCSTCFEFLKITDITVNGLLNILLETAPDIIHFAGHGGDGYIYLYGEDNKLTRVSFETIKKLLENRNSNGVLNTTKLFFNACYSDGARDLLTVVDTVVGTRGVFSDNSAIMFASYFYKSLCRNYDFKNAFDFAMLSLELNNTFDMNVPILIMNKK